VGETRARTYCERHERALDGISGRSSRDGILDWQTIILSAPFKPPRLNTSNILMLSLSL
jgi:hypothetical protein